MSQATLSKRTFACLQLAACASMLALAFAPAVNAQTEDTRAMKAKAISMVDDLRFAEALPILEKLAAATPSDPDIHRNLGFALIAQSLTTPDKAAAKQFRMRARAAFVKARETGDDSPLVAGMIESTPVDGGDEGSFTFNEKANEIMRQGEAAFSSGKLDEALELYQAALKIDPTLYYAALFSGDVYMHKGKFPDAEVWYQRAIRIDPNRETAYRYSATPLMKQQKYDQARDRYVEAWITEPYSRFAIQGIVQWGQATNTPLAHPKVELPEITIGPDGKAKSTINVNPLADDGSMAWMMYAATREAWRSGKFAKTFPNEKTYRHTLQEEAEALRDVIKFARSKPSKTTNAQIEILSRLDQDGLLEAFILMALPDEGIALDHAAYLRSDRAKLRLYVTKYVIGGGK